MHIYENLLNPKTNLVKRNKKLSKTVVTTVFTVLIVQ